jgi:hypothetical protein
VASNHTYGKVAWPRFRNAATRAWRPEHVWALDVQFDAGRRANAVAARRISPGLLIEGP